VASLTLPFERSHQSNSKSEPREPLAAEILKRRSEERGRAAGYQSSFKERHTVIPLARASQIDGRVPVLSRDERGRCQQERRDRAGAPDSLRWGRRLGQAKWTTLPSHQSSKRGVERCPLPPLAQLSRRMGQRTFVLSEESAPQARSSETDSGSPVMQARWRGVSPY
jgi:hypothetical protein